MAKRHRDGADLTSKVYARARKRMLANLAARLDELDAIYGQDAEKLKKALAPMLRLAGVSERRVAETITAVMSESRAARMGVLEQAIRDGAAQAQGIDAATYRAVFVGEPETPPPKAPRASGSSPKQTPSLRLVSESEDEPPSTD
jgi:hypothetical protein